ncbi:MAG: DsbC family protein [Ramlibacter sp.]|nr:DsbC family protein [Ramlibacter sp.]
MNPTKRLFLLSSLGAALLLAGCKDASQPGPGAAAPAPPAAVSAPVSIEAITAEAQGFNVGSTMSARTVYVFFDAQCPHCAALWEAAKPLKSQARFVWIPVGLLNENSTLQGAAILASADPVAAMEQHEVSMREKKGGIAPAGGDAQKQAVGRNTQLMTKFGFPSVPTIVGKHAQTGELVTIDGALPTAALAAKLGLQAPGA